MPTIYSAVRYTVLGVFIACNAIIASVAVWNLSITQTARISFPIVPYIIFVGVASLLTTFSIIFVELGRRSAVAVWVECMWTGTFLLMSLLGASILSATVPSALCSSRAILTPKESCVSTRVVLAFTWISSIIMLVYFSSIVVTAILRHRHHPRIWKCSILSLPSFDSTHLGSTPTTPILPRFIGSAVTAPAIAAPKPRRPVPDVMYAYRSGLSADYEIEHFQGPQPLPPAAASNMGAWSSGQTAIDARSFYTQAVQSALHSQGGDAAALHLPQPAPVLGAWPRADAMRQPAYSTIQTHSLHMSQTSPSAGSPPRPRGPKRQSSGGLRPPPLDLSKVSTFNRTN